MKLDQHLFDFCQALRLGQYGIESAPFGALNVDLQNVDCRLCNITHRVLDKRYTCSSSAWAHAGFFPGVGNKGVRRTEVQEQLPSGGLGVKPPEADDIFSKWCINTSSTEVLYNICSKKHFFNISRGGDKCPLPMPAGAYTPVVYFKAATHGPTSDWNL